MPGAAQSHGHARLSDADQCRCAEKVSIVSNPKQVKNGRVDVVDRGWVITILWLEAPFIAQPMRHTPTNARPTKPVGEAEGIVISPLPPRTRHSAKFSRP